MFSVSYTFPFSDKLKKTSWKEGSRATFRRSFTHNRKVLKRFQRISKNTTRATRPMPARNAKKNFLRCKNPKMWNLFFELVIRFSWIFILDNSKCIVFNIRNCYSFQLSLEARNSTYIWYCVNSIRLKLLVFSLQRGMC